MNAAAELPVCRYTRSKNVEVIYQGPIRSGGARSGFEDGYRVLRCAESGLVWLDPFPENLDEYYTTDAYWNEHHHGNAEVDRLRRKLDHEQSLWLSKIGTSPLRDKVVADFGCGAGIFFDFIKGIAAQRIGVDLALPYKSHLENEGHEFRMYGTDLGTEWADVVVSFDTLEHVPEPWVFLREINRSLRSGGTAFIGVPNQRDFLKEIVPAYLPFFYHRSHLWYFTAEALSRLVEEAGFVIEEVESVHKYDLNNMIVWARDGKGEGKKGCPTFDRRTEEAFISNIERQGIGSHILLRARKS